MPSQLSIPPFLCHYLSLPPCFLFSLVAPHSSPLYPNFTSFLFYSFHFSFHSVLTYSSSLFQFSSSSFLLSPSPPPAFLFVFPSFPSHHFTDSIPVLSPQTSRLLSLLKCTLFCFFSFSFHGSPISFLFVFPSFLSLSHVPSVFPHLVFHSYTLLFVASLLHSFFINSFTAFSSFIPLCFFLAFLFLT